MASYTYILDYSKGCDLTLFIFLSVADGAGEIIGGAGNALSSVADGAGDLVSGVGEVVSNVAENVGDVAETAADTANGCGCTLQ